MGRSTQSRFSKLLHIIGLAIVVLLPFASSASGQSCGELGGTYCSDTFGCPPGFVSLGGTYDCNTCCQEEPPPAPRAGSSEATFAVSREVARVASRPSARPTTANPVVT